MGEGKVMRISEEMRRRLLEYQKTQIVIHNKPISIVEASRQFARTAVAKDDNLKTALTRMGKNWKFKI